MIHIKCKVQDKILEFVGPRYFHSLRSVTHAWNKKMVAILAANNWRVRVWPQNIDEYCESDLLRPASLSTRTRMKISLDFGKVTAVEQFHHLIDSVSDIILKEDGPISVEKFVVRESEANFHQCHFTKEDWEKLETFIQLLSPGLRVLHLEYIDSGLSAPVEHNLKFWASNLFPNLTELSVCLGTKTYFLFVYMLQPEATPQLTKLQFKNVSDLPDTFVRDVLYRLQTMPQLSELSLDLDGRMSDCLGDFSIVISTTVRRLHLELFESIPIKIFKGRFIGIMFPELRLLDLEYKPVLPQSEMFREWTLCFFPDIGTLQHLTSLIYRKTDFADQGSDGSRREIIREIFVRKEDSEPLREKFPFLQNVTTQLDFELLCQNTENPDLLQLPSVKRMQLQIPPTAVPPNELERLTGNLHRNYPNISCLAIDLKNISSETAQVVAANAIKSLLTRIDDGALEEFELINCHYELEIEALLLELMDGQKLSSCWSHVRRLKLTSAISHVTDASTVEMTKSTSTLSLSKIFAELPQLDLIQIDELLGHSEIDQLYRDAAELKIANPSLKIEIN